DALGAKRVHCVMLPSQYTSTESLEDAAACAAALGVKLDTVPIAPPVDAVEQVLAPVFKGHNADITEENIQSRLRGTLLMAMSNKFGNMVVTTGNKSEVSVGYATLYGDMNGGYNPIKDIYKTEVFRLARWRNAHRPAHALGPSGVVIPDAIIDKPPSAELRPDQKDEDSLPPYEVLDDILMALVENEAGVEDIIDAGHDRDTVRRIEHLLYISEYKRRQAAPGAKIGNRNFGRDRRYPITNGFRDARLLSD
ncbi:MAG: NAD(+) synthase, partial [Rhodobiaceae bacterium]